MPEGTELNDLLVSYLLKELDIEQERYVAGLIKSDKNLQERYNKLQALLGILEIEKGVAEIDLNQEFAFFNRLGKNEVKTPGPKVQGAPSAELGMPNKEDRLPAKRFWIAAASIALIVVTGLFVFRVKPGNSVGFENKGIAFNPVKPKIYHESNLSGKVKTIVLEDGTLVKLFDRSEIDFPQNFSGGRRDIHLTGQAQFKVAKDKTRPFTVYSDQIATTAVGTEFTVSSYSHENSIRVRLFEGKVVIRSLDTSLGKVSGLCYLIPGQELVYNKKNSTFKINDSKISRHGIQSNSRLNNIADSPSMPSDRTGNWFMFNNQRLSEVLNELSQLYAVHINYRKQDVATMYFIGKFDKKDSLEYILRNIALINKLTLVKEENGYRIKK